MDNKNNIYRYIEKFFQDINLSLGQFNFKILTSSGHLRS